MSDLINVKESKPCPRCGKSNKLTARKCWTCSQEFDDQEDSSVSDTSLVSVILLLIAVAMGVPFVLFMVCVASVKSQ